MIAVRDRRRSSLLTAASWGSALTAAFALIGLIVITGGPGTPGLALRADSYNQMTGIGSTASAITVPWTGGLLDSTNTPITSATASTDGGPELNPNSDRAAGTGSLFFYDSDFKTLSVTVSQTENITQQGITVSWTGAPASIPGNPWGDFMQMMECYGDNTDGPSPEDCEYGSPRMLGTQIFNLQIGSRIGALCTAGASPSTSSPPSPLAGGGPPSGCDPNEPAAETVTHCDPTTGSPNTCAVGDYSIPFVPADDTANHLYGAGATGTGTGTLFNQFDTNEVQAANTALDGTGTHQFETLTANQAPGLGCGETESNGQTRNCWLVIVPRGSYATNGYQASAGVPLQSSPLSAGNWAQRIQIHLDYAPLAADCPPTVLPDAMVGTQVIYRAVTSWQSALNQAANCSKVYSYTATTESAASTQLDTPGGDGLAFTTVPIGSEIARDDLPALPTPLPTILYAPVAVTALGFGFNINLVKGGQIITPVNLTPSLLARALTQVYKPDLPDNQPGPAWVQGNPASWVTDPSFTALNSGISSPNNGAPDFPLITGDHTGVNQQIWQWVQSDPATATWLDGGTDPNNPLTADPGYVTLKLGQSPASDNFSEAYTGTLTCADAATQITQCSTVNGGSGVPDLTNPNPPYVCPVPAGDTANPDTKACDVLDSEDLLPVENNFDQAAAVVLSGVDPSDTTQWLSQSRAPDGTNGWWGTIGTELPGHTFMWAVNDMPDLAAYGLISAALCLPTATAATTSTACVQPSTASVTTALNSATTDSAGLLEVNPATVPSGGYPLTDVVYAAVPTDQPASALADYANFISYAAGQGQTPGTAPGDLPAGYLPLTPALQAQAQSVVTQLQTLASGSASPSASPTISATGTTSATPTPTGESTTTGGTTTSGGTTTTGGSTTSGGTTTSGGSTTSGGTTATGGTTAGRSTATGASASGHPTQSAASSSSATPTEGFDVLPPSAQAAAGTTPDTAVGPVRGVLIIVLIIGAAGGVAGGVLRYGHLPVRGRSRQRTGTP